MKAHKKTIVAMAVALVFSAVLAAQAQMSLVGLTNTNSKKVTAPTVVTTPVSKPSNSNKPADPPSGPVGTPGSDKTLKKHVEALEAAVAALQTAVSTLESQISTLTTNLSNLQTQVNNLSIDVAAIQANPALDLGPYVSVNPDEVNGLAGPNIFFTGANVHIISGSGATHDAFPVLMGLGNLVIGYNEEPGGMGMNDRLGSHNLVVGPYHIYPTYGGIVAGSTNKITGESASVTGGQNNEASGKASSVGGGAFRNATGIDNWAAGSLYELN